MKKFFLSIIFLVSIFSGCGTENPGAPGVSLNAKGIFKSSDGGEIFEVKNRIDDKKNIEGEDVLSMEVDEGNPVRIFIGTEKGIFRSINGGDNFEQVSDAKRVFGLAVDRRNSNLVYAAGILNKRGKIIKSTDGGVNWEAVYTEPEGDFLITSLTLNSYNPNEVYAGTSRGVILKTEDAGKNWKNIGVLDGPILEIVFDSKNYQEIYFRVHEKGIFKTDYSRETNKEQEQDYKKQSVNKLEQGIKIYDLSNNLRSANKEIRVNNVFSITADPLRARTFYLGTDGGIIKTEDGGETWKEIPTLEGPGGIPIRSLVVSGRNNAIIYYGAGGTFYRSFDGGSSWQVMSFKTSYTIEKLAIDPNNEKIIYLGIRNRKQSKGIFTVPQWGR